MPAAITGGEKQFRSESPWRPWKSVHLLESSSCWMYKSIFFPMKVLCFMVCKQPRVHKRACTLCELMNCNSFKYILLTIWLSNSSRTNKHQIQPWHYQGSLMITLTWSYLGTCILACKCLPAPYSAGSLARCSTLIQTTLEQWAFKLTLRDVEVTVQNVNFTS